VNKRCIYYEATRPFLRQPHKAAFNIRDIFTALHTALYIRLSVCQSHAWIVIKRKKLLPKFLYHIQGPFI